MKLKILHPIFIKYAPKCILFSNTSFVDTTQAIILTIAKIICGNTTLNWKFFLSRTTYFEVTLNFILRHKISFIMDKVKCGAIAVS